MSLSGNHFWKERKLVIVVKLHHLALVTLIMKCLTQNTIFISASQSWCAKYLFGFGNFCWMDPDPTHKLAEYREYFHLQDGLPVEEKKKDGKMIHRWTACSIQSLVQLLILIASTTLVWGPKNPTKTICIRKYVPFLFIDFFNYEKLWLWVT